MSEETIFTEALRRGTAAEQKAYLDEACQANVALREQVEALLKSHLEGGSFLGQPLPDRLADQLAMPKAVEETEGEHSPADNGQAIRFLAPSDKADSLGRLGHYEVEEVIGRGGMGIVLRAFDEKLHRVVAIKVMTAPLATNATARKRFTREARAAAAVSHDHVVTIHGVEETSDLPYLVMQYVSGVSLQERLDKSGPLQLHEILRIGMQAATGLAAAHAQGLVHRDIKPSNILLENGVERVKITDFGLAHAVDDVRTTQPGTVIGTPEYMSPEQARGEKVDHRSDLFSLGCVLYAMCAGRPPFRAESTVAIIRRVCDDTPRPLVEINPDIPEWLVDLIDKLIAKEASERFQSAAEVAELLGQYLAHVQQPSSAPLPTFSVGHALRGVPSRRRNGTEAVPYKNSRPWAVAAAILLLLTATLALAESTGVTTVAATVIRIVRGDGTLVVEIDDPNIQVLLDGEELVISGAGPKEIRLRPGQHELHTVKDGKPVETKLVTITRDGRQVVKVAREEPAAAAPTGPSTRLVWADAADANVAVSPDGRSLAFVDWETGDLAVRDLASSKNRRLTNKGSWSESPEFALLPKFSADGTQLAYTWYDKAGKANLRVVGVNGGDPRVVYNDKDSPEPYGWSPDGKWILAAFYPSRERMEIASVGLTDGAVRIIKTLDDWRPSKVGHLKLAPDGQTIAYSRVVEPASVNHHIFVIDVATGSETQLTTHAADMRVLAWTPDGERLLFDMERQGARDAWVIRIVGGKPQGEAELVKKDLGAIVPQGFTRDGTFYYGSSSRGPSLFTATLDLKKATATATPLSAEKFNISDRFLLGDWSPDGESLAYWAKSRVSEELRIASVKTGQTRVLKPEVRNIALRFRWSPDGRSFLFQNFALGIYQVDAVSGEVVERGKGRQPIWSRDGRGIFHAARSTGESIRIVHRHLQTQTETEVPMPGNLVNRRSNFWFELSPDGRQLALLGKANGESMVLWLIPVDGGSPRELLKVNSRGNAVGVAGGVGWTPDGTHVLYTQLGGDESQGGLWYIPASGGEPRKVALTGVEAKDVTRIAIHPDGKQLALTASGTGKSEVWALENFLPLLADSKPPAAADASAAKSKSAASADTTPAIISAREHPAPAGPTSRQVWANASADSVSVDGRYLAFVDWETGDLAVRDLATGQNRRVTNKGTWDESSEYALSPKFSADGKLLAYTWKGDLRVIRVEGGEPRILNIDTNGRRVHPETYAWMPDGKSILAGLHFRERLQISLVNVTDGSVRVVKALDGRRGNVGRFSLAPDGQTIAYSRLAEPGSANRSIFLIDVESGQETQATTHAADTYVLAWTPDRRRLLFAMQRQGGWDAWAMQIAAGKPQGEPQLVKADLGTVEALGFTGDGALYYYSLQFGGPSLFTAALDLEKGIATATPLPGEKLSVMDQFSAPMWSPDGRHLAYKADPPNRIQEIRIIPVEGGPTRVLQPDLSFLNNLCWAPDGRSFISTAQKELGRIDIYQIDASTGDATAIFEPQDKDRSLSGPVTPRWSPDGRGIFYVMGNRIFYRDVNAGSEREIFAAGNPGSAYLRFDVSPDGRQLAVVGRDGTTNSTCLRIISVDGGASNELCRFKPVGGAVLWTPDGRFVLFTQHGADEKDQGLWCISVKGGDPRKVELSGAEAKGIKNLAIHPDGKQLAFNVTSSRKDEVWALENFLPPLADSKPPAAADASSAKSE